jgi:Flp pilus assembly protein TadD
MVLFKRRDFAAICLRHLAAIVFFATFLGLVLVPPCLAQGGINYSGNGGRHTIQGRIYFPSGRRADSMGVKVRLESLSLGDLVTFADPNGSFSFKNLTPGTYSVTIEASADYEASREAVYIDDPGSSSMRGARAASSSTPRIMNVQIYLQIKRSVSSASKPGVLRAELANVPQPALAHYESAVAASRAGDSKKAVEELKSAVVLYPQFSVALTDLGVQYLKLSQTEQAASPFLSQQAASSFRSALKLSPDDFTALLGYGIALQNIGDFVESEKQFRQAVKKNDASATAHMYLGIGMVRLKRLSEAQRELELAITLEGGDNLPAAHRYLGGIYWSLKDKRAADQLEKYVKLAPTAPDVERIRSTIKELRSKN